MSDIPAATSVKQTLTPATPIEKEKKPTTGNGAGSKASASVAQGKRAQADFFKAFGGGTKKKDSKLEDAPTPTAASAKPSNCEPVKPPPSTLKGLAPLSKTEIFSMDLHNEPAGCASESPPKRHSDDDPEEPPPEEVQDSDNEEDSNMSRPLAKGPFTIAEQYVQRKKEREEKLRRMMDDSDEDPTLVSKQDAVLLKKEDYDSEDPDEIPTSAQKPSAAATDTAPPNKGSPGRRRGRRKVKKRISTRDKDGYLVVSHEMVWESYSEDEVAARIPLAPTPAAQKPMVEKEEEKQKEDAVLDGGKKKRAAAVVQKKIGQGQGNIMNFFGKK